MALGASSCPRDGTPISRVGPARPLPDEETVVRPPENNIHLAVTPLMRPGLTKDPLIGSRLGDYVVEERIGSGGIGIVYRARHPQIGKAVAIKVLKPEVAADPRHVERLLAEARAVSAIGHRGIVDIFGFGELPDGRQYVVMELLQGRALDEVIAEHQRLPPQQVVALLEEMMSALGAAHAAGVIHRDLKPSNLFLVAQPDGRELLKVLDFGLAQHGPGAETAKPGALFVGTAEYMAPEQCSADPVSPQTDLYAVGVIAFELLTGELPLQGKSPVEFYMAHLRDQPTAPSSRVGGLDPGLDALVLRLLAKAPADRPGSAEQVRTELRKLRKRLSPEGTVMLRLIDVKKPARSSARPAPQRPSRPSSAAGREQRTKLVPALGAEESVSSFPEQAAELRSRLRRLRTTAERHDDLTSLRLVDLATQTLERASSQVELRKAESMIRELESSLA